jgi:hypothetical protein
MSCRSFSVGGVEPGSYRVRILAEGYAYASSKVSVSGTGRSRGFGTIRLEAGGTIEGRVPGHTGDSYRRIEVANHRLSGRCDSQGRFLIENVPVGTLRIRQATVLKYTGAELEVTVRAGETTRVTFRH